MRRYILVRVLQGIVAVVAVSMIVFLATRLSGDIALLMIPLDATEEDYQEMRQYLGVDKPIYIQYLIFVGNSLQGDFGESYRWKQPTMELILARMPATIQLATVSMVFSTIVALPLGMLSAVKRGSWLDGLGKTFAVLGQSMPNFWLGLMLIIVFAVQLRLLPTAGRGGIEHLILPAVTLGWFGMASKMRLMRSAMLDVLDSEYIKMARIKGVAEPLVIFKHALRNAAIPVVTLMGIQWSFLLSGSVIVETIFAWPGVGRTIIEAINARDYPVVQAAVIFLSVLVITMYVLMDLLYAAIDPRIRFA